LQKQAGAQRERGQWPDAAQTLLTMRETYPEYASGAEADLELLFRDIRWRYTRYRDHPPDLSRAEVEALRPAIEKAESLGIVGARMLLGEHLSTRADWRRAIAHYEKARDRAPKATTRIGLLYARFSTQPEELARAWEYFQTAHQAGDLDGKIAVAECLLYGTFGDTGGGKFVPGLEADAQKGAQLLREIIGTRPSRRVPAELADARLTETYLTEPNRSKLVLGSFYLDWERNLAKQQDWYRLEKKQIDHPREMRRLLEEAREDWTDAYSQLGNAAREGLGGKPDPAAARAYFQEGARRNNLQATFNYAVLLTQSAPPGTIPAEARQLFQTAAERGHPLALDFCTKNKIPVTPKAPPPQ